MLEGRSWMEIAVEKFPCRIVGNMRKGHLYLYQIYTTAFIEFFCMEDLNDCREWLDKNVPYWDYDPVATLDIRDSEVIKRWKSFIIE